MTVEQIKLDLVSKILALDSVETLERLAALITNTVSGNERPASEKQVADDKVLQEPVTSYVSPRPPVDLSKYPPGRPKKVFDLEEVKRARPVKPIADGGELDRKIKAINWDKDVSIDTMLEMINE